MGEYRVNKTSLTGEVIIPPSKSHTLRAILFGALGNGKTVIHDYLPCMDTQAMINTCRLFGASVIAFPRKIEIEGLNGKIESAEDVINAGNSGIVLRFCTAISSLAKHPIVITGDHSIRHQRSIEPLLDALRQLSVSATTTRGDGYAPVIIQGPLKPGKTVVNGEDSQPVSALLIASIFSEGRTEIEVINPGELPWIQLTLDWLDRLGIHYKNDNYQRYCLPGQQYYNGFEFRVPGDLSSAAFPLAAALVTQSELTLKNVDMNDSQGDKELVRVFQKMGAQIDIDEKNKILHVKKRTRLHGIKVDLNNFIDAITILAVVACYADGETHIFNAAVAKQKECNRIHCIATELRKMGAKITETDDGLIVTQSPLNGAVVQSHHDHRMAMSLTVAGLGAHGETTIVSTECIAKTYPSFLHDLNSVCANIEEKR